MQIPNEKYQLIRFLIFHIFHHVDKTPNYQFLIKYYKKNKNADFIYWTRHIYKPQELEASFSENKFFEKIITKILKRE